MTLARIAAGERETERKNRISARCFGRLGDGWRKPVFADRDSNFLADPRRRSYSKVRGKFHEIALRPSQIWEPRVTSHRAQMQRSESVVIFIRNSHLLQLSVTMCTYGCLFQLLAWGDLDANRCANSTLLSWRRGCAAITLNPNQQRSFSKGNWQWDPQYSFTSSFSLLLTTIRLSP
jgi:hypothetical protein